MNKKILFLIILGIVVILPMVTFGASGKTLDTMATAVKEAAIAIAVPIVVVGWVIAGILFLTAAGGSRMEIAKKALMACVVGTVLVALAIGSGAIMEVIKNAFGL